MKLILHHENFHFTLPIPHFLFCPPLVYLALRKTQPISYAAARALCQGLRGMKKRQSGMPLLDVETRDTRISLKL